MDPRTAVDEIAFIRGIVDRTQRRIDPHAFHFVHWGAIVLVWFPAAQALANAGRLRETVIVGIAAVVLGVLLSTVREIRLGRRPRLAGDNTFIGRQVGIITAANLVAGFALSAIPALGVFDGRLVPVLWGLVYANMAFMVGVVYHRDFLVSGCVIFAGVLAALLWMPWAGYVLGPAMGLGMIVPGIRAEQRVRHLAAETAGGDA